jgi:hypothetical protein
MNGLVSFLIRWLDWALHRRDAFTFRGTVVAGWMQIGQQTLKMGKCGP